VGIVLPDFLPLHGCFPHWGKISARSTVDNRIDADHLGVPAMSSGKVSRDQPAVIICPRPPLPVIHI
jgi:hypothetical protein